MNIYRVDFQSGIYGCDKQFVLVVSDNIKDAEDVVMRRAGSLFAWASDRIITKITLIEGRVFVESPVSFEVERRETESLLEAKL